MTMAQLLKPLQSTKEVTMRIKPNRGGLPQLKNSPNKIGGKQPIYPSTSAKKFLHEDIGKDDKDIKVNKSQTIKVNNDNFNNDKDK